MTLPSDRRAAGLRRPLLDFYPRFGVFHPTVGLNFDVTRSVTFSFASCPRTLTPDVPALRLCTSLLRFLPRVVFFYMKIF